MKNETTKERLIALESRINCFPCGETENLDMMTLSPTKSTARDLYKKIQITFSERISYTPGKSVLLILNFSSPWMSLDQDFELTFVYIIVSWFRHAIFDGMILC